MADKLDALYSKFLKSKGVSIDTRTIKEDQLFFAISGPNFNGNTFAQEALDKGASFAVIDDAAYGVEGRTVLVENGIHALQDLASLHRHHFKGPVLGITGSNGKTTTKELITKVLAEKYKVHATKGNFNNHIGVPLTILEMKEDAEIAIIEMGANHVGEIASYCEVAKPTHGLITNIGRAHTETFGGIEGVIRGKSELFDFLRKTGGKPFINVGDRVLANMSKRFADPMIYPKEGLEPIEATPFLKVRVVEDVLATSLVGAYNFSNVAAAIAVGSFFEVERDKMLQAIEAYRPDNARSEIIQRGSTTIILDAYNANPDSMKVALDSLADHQGKKVAILGDMNELENSDHAHVEIINHAVDLEIDQILTVGNKIGKVADPVNHFTTKKDLEAYLKDIDFRSTTVLLKASRSIKLETILNSIH